MSIFNKAAAFAKANPELALILAGAVVPKIARKAVKYAPIVRAVVKAAK